MKPNPNLVRNFVNHSNLIDFFCIRTQPLILYLCLYINIATNFSSAHVIQSAYFGRKELNFPGIIIEHHGVVYCLHMTARTTKSQRTMWFLLPGASLSFHFPEKQLQCFDELISKACHFSDSLKTVMTYSIKQRAAITEAGVHCQKDPDEVFQKLSWAQILYGTDQHGSHSAHWVPLSSPKIIP